MEGSSSSSEEERHSSWYVGGTVGGERLSMLAIFMLSDEMGQSKEIEGRYVEDSMEGSILWKVCSQDCKTG
jgi:hypothetical protein